MCIIDRLYTVTLAVPAEVSGLLSGMFADVVFHTDVSENTIVIPSEAILTSCLLYTSRCV